MPIPKRGILNCQFKRRRTQSTHIWGDGMLALLGLAATGALMNADMAKIPIEYETVSPAETRIPVSESVRAATFDQLADKPAQPKRLRLACIVLDRFGAPGDCVPASRLPLGQKTVDWASIHDIQPDLNQLEPAAETALRRVAGQRISTARLAERPKTKNLFVIRVFEEEISPADARPAFTPSEEPLPFTELKLAKPIDGELVRLLYPALALRNSVTARVSMICRVTEKLTLLCRDPGSVVTMPNYMGPMAPALEEAFRFSTYQLASTLSFAPDSVSGQAIAGKDVRFAIRWLMP